MKKPPTLFSTTVSYIGRYPGWLRGILVVLAVYLLLFLALSFILLINAIDAWRMGYSVMEMIRLNVTWYGMQQAIRSLFIWIFLPSLAVGAAGGTISELFYKKNKLR